MMKETGTNNLKATPVEVYAELTPNPDSMKFVTSRMLLADVVAEYVSKEDAIDCPLAYQLFDFSGIKRVFITSNFLTISKEPGIDWFDITNILREFIRGFLLSDEKLFLKSPIGRVAAPAPKPAQLPKVASVEKQEDEISVPDDPEIEEKIKQLLDEYVRPAVEGDGGAIHFQSFENGTVNVVLKGACSGCPSSTVTLKGGIENLLKRMLPQVKEVVAVNE